MEALFDILINGLIVTSSILLLALGLSLIFGVLGVVNICHGALFTCGAFFYFLAVKFQVPFLPALGMAMITGFVMGIIIEKAVFYPLRNNHLSGVIAAFGLSFVIEVLLGLSFGKDLKSVPQVVNGIFDLGFMTIDAQRLLTIIGAVILSSALVFLIHYTKIGRGIRAVAQNNELSLLVGINPSTVRLVTLGSGVGLALIAGVLVSPTSYVDPYVGSELLTQAFAAVIVGGLGSIHGAIVGSAIVGFLLACGLYFAPIWANAILFGTIVLVLVIRPQGIIPFESV